MAQFYSNEEVSLKKEVNCDKRSSLTKQEDLEFIYEIQRCADWVKTNSYKNVCLQFPDSLLPDSTEVALKLRSILGQQVYIMADTAYESCCVDYLTAAHVNADAIIHFGPTCFSKPSGHIPCLKIYEKGNLDLTDFDKMFTAIYNENIGQIWVLLDTPYELFKDELTKKFTTYKNVSIVSVDDNLNLGSCFTVFISKDIQKLHVLAQRFSDDNLFYYNPESLEPITNYKQDFKLAKRRYFLIEKIKDSNTLGIIIGTLAIKNYLKVIERIKKLAQLHSKKYYIISVGRPTVAKLANFPEIDVYVLVSCAMNKLHESREFYKPFVTPYDVEVALNPNAKVSQFSFDFNSYFSEVDLENNSDLENIKDKIKESDMSLISGKIRTLNANVHSSEVSSDTNEIALKSDGTVMLNSHYGASFLAERSWKGLEKNLGKNQPVLAEEGRKGLAMGYENEKEKV